MKITASKLRTLIKATLNEGLEDYRQVYSSLSYGMQDVLKYHNLAANMFAINTMRIIQQVMKKKGLRPHFGTPNELAMWTISPAPADGGFEIKFRGHMVTSHDWQRNMHKFRSLKLNPKMSDKKSKLQLIHF